MDYTEQLTAEEAEKLRTELIASHVEPTVRSVFERVPEVQSAVLLVSQMWCDEAADAVHGSVRFSQRAEPGLHWVRERLDGGPVWGCGVVLEGRRRFESSRRFAFRCPSKNADVQCRPCAR